MDVTSHRPLKGSLLLAHWALLTRPESVSTAKPGKHLDRDVFRVCFDQLHLQGSI
jgi:hypothetical protein